MKKILLSPFFLVSLVVTQAQLVKSTVTGTSGASHSAVHTNADTSYTKFNLDGTEFSFDSYTVVLTGTKTSGTVGGTVVPFGSLDGSTWIQIYDKDSVSSQSFTNGDNALKWQFDKARWAQVRFRIYTTGTQVSSYGIKLYGRKLVYKLTN